MTDRALTLLLQLPRRRWRRWRWATSSQTNVGTSHLTDALSDENSQIAALGSWADEMDAQPLPAAGSGYSARNAQRGAGGDREEGRAMASSAWERSAGGIGGGSSSAGRVAGFGKASRVSTTILRPC